MILKYPYKIKIHEKFGSVRVEFENEQEPKNNELISLFFGSDVQPSIGSVKDTIGELDSVLNGKKEKFECSYNGSYIEVDKHQVIIEELFPDDDDNPLTCQIETIELRKLLLIWYRAVVTYQNKQGVIEIKEKEEALDWIEEQQKIGDKLEENLER
ncbi:hypothetical protein QUF88_06750 [Bacillus sp. DX1.1]|uniref:hypothetical protein n=1 Tax=unclassified Bacillus (in: firmicutes) TaxID=185979 RepID=UPI0025709C7B|nr:MULTISPECIES: hypothetical protein [unclassified Bacillus (in: firmicutes)]MDM5153543.1 hypothetical protein [Bacillus sp. DX1.1]WJE82495.1 hypothetical protein QRE67_04270 [Bacillus sp. DX3.1]